MTNVLSYVNNIRLKKHEDAKIKIIVSSAANDNNCVEVIGRLFLDDKLTGFVYAVSGYSEDLAKLDVMQPFLDPLKDMDKDTPLICFCEDAFHCRFVKSDMFVPVERAMIRMMHSCCPDADNCNIVRCACTEDFNIKKKLSLRCEIERYWKYPLLWP